MENIAAVLDKAPVGFGFRPTDEELVDHYLRHKLLDDDDRVNIFPEIDLCKVEPWQVPGLLMIKADGPQRFFFSPVDYKYLNSKRVNRTTNCGFWKSTGNDRYIKVGGTVIGTKKTLVYYKGRVPNGVKSNWVIHEYRAVTVPENQRRFVLCHLKNKAGKGGIDASICDEGDPSTGGHTASSDDENMATEEGVPTVDVLLEMHMGTHFQPMHQEEIDFAPLQQSPNSIEQGASPADNAYFKNENCIMQTPSETTEEGNELPTSISPPIQQSPIGTMQETSLTSFSAHDVSSRNEDYNMQIPFETIEEGNESLAEKVEEFLKVNSVDEDFVPSEESGHVFVNTSTQPESLKRIHYRSNDTDAEATSLLFGNTLAMCNEHPSSGEDRVSKMLKSTHGTVDGGIHLVSSDQEANKEENIIQNDFCGVEWRHPLVTRGQLC